jgi:hypothetical protein
MNKTVRYKNRIEAKLSPDQIGPTVVVGNCSGADAYGAAALQSSVFLPEAFTDVLVEPARQGRRGESATAEEPVSS